MSPADYDRRESTDVQYEKDRVRNKIEITELGEARDDRQLSAGEAVAVDI